MLGGWGIPMSVSQRVGRGFHRLALLLAGLVLVAGVVASSFIGVQGVNRARENPEYIEQAEMACAQEAVRKKIAPQLRISKREADLPRQVLELKVSLNQLGCSDERKIVTVAEVLDAHAPDALTYVTAFLGVFSLGLGITVSSSMAVYGLVRAIGWIVGGFTWRLSDSSTDDLPAPVAHREDAIVRRLLPKRGVDPKAGLTSIFFWGSSSRLRATSFNCST
jgi:hypothetical protein